MTGPSWSSALAAKQGDGKTRQAAVSSPGELKWLDRTRYAGSCHCCHIHLPSGTSAWWSPRTHALLCAACGPSRPASKRTAEVAPAPSAEDGELQQRWQRLVAYLRACVATEAAGDLACYEERSRWSVLPLHEERLVCGTGDLLPLGDDLQSRFSRLRPGETLRYGWPVLLRADRTGRLRVVPVLVTDLSPPEEGATCTGPSDDEPSLNPGLLAGELLEAETAEQLSSIVADGLPFGDAGAMSSLTSALATVLDACAPPVDPRSLRRTLPCAPGIHNVALVVQSQSPAMTKGLLEELAALEHRSDWRGTAAAHLLGWHPLPPPFGAPRPAASPLPLNGSQERVVDELRTAPLTVVTGPPGTGKSQVVVAAVANAWLDGETVLVASTNNAAVDVATERASAVARPLLVRTGNKAFRDALPETIGALLAEAKAATHDETAARRDLALAATGRRALLDLLERRQALVAALTGFSRACEDAAERSWGDRVPPERAPGPDALLVMARRAAEARLLAGWRRRRLLQRVGALPTASVHDLVAWAAAERSLRDGASEIAELDGHIGDEAMALSDTEAAWVAASRSAIAATCASTLARHAGVVSQLDTARGGGPGLSRLVAAALRGVRGWSCTALAAKPNFPLVPGLFDLVIVDEASQCSLAAVLPLAYRAKRLAVVGDPNQLRPIVGLDEHSLNRLADVHGLVRHELRATGQDYGSGSAYLAFEAVVGPERVCLLEEHYRCHPQIARWFNTAFYGDRLEVLTDVASLPPGARGLSWIDVEGTAERGQYGSASNRSEAEHVVALLGTLLDEEVSVAVVSPFALQAALIDELAVRRYGRERLGAAGFTCGAAHRLQGDERDVVVFSTVIAPGISERSARWVERERNLVNVAASRARRSLVVVGHPSAATDFQVPTLASLRRTAFEGVEPEAAPWRIDSVAEERLVAALHEAEFVPHLKVNVEGYVLDMALLLEDRRIDIEVDGDEHLDARGRSRRRDLARDRVLAGLGWQVLRVPAWRCHREVGVVAAEVAAAVARPAVAHGPRVHC